MNQQETQATPDTVTERLLSFSKDIDRQAALAFERFGDLATVARASEAIPAEQRAAIEQRIAEQLPPIDPRFARIDSPQPESLSARGLQLLRV